MERDFTRKEADNFFGVSRGKTVVTAAVVTLMGNTVLRCHAALLWCHLRASPSCSTAASGVHYGFSLMVFRVLMAGFRMKWVMNHKMSSLGLMRVPTVSQRH